MELKTNGKTCLEVKIQYWGQSYGMQLISSPSQEMAKKSCVEIITSEWFDVDKVDYLGWTNGFEGECYYASKNFVDRLNPQNKKFVNACKRQTQIPNGQQIEFTLKTDQIFKDGLTDSN